MTMSSTLTTSEARRGLYENINLSNESMTDTVKHGRKQYEHVTYHTAGVQLPEAFYTITELNELIAKIERRDTVTNLALARSMGPIEG